MAQINSNTGPHIRCEENTRSIMLDVLIALCPSLIWGFYAFGLRAAVLFVLSVSSGIFFEWLILKIFKGRKGNAADLSAAVTGAILVCLMPVGVPLWMAPTASFLAIVLFKHLCGGSPNNRLNPALAALSLLYVIFPEHLTRLSRPFEYLPAIKALPDGAQKDVFDVSRTFQLFKSGAFPEDLTWSQLLTGSVAGGVASTSTLLLLAGGAVSFGASCYFLAHSHHSSFYKRTLLPFVCARGD